MAAAECAGGGAGDGSGVIRRVHSFESGDGGAAERNGCIEGGCENSFKNSKLAGGATMAKPSLIYPVYPSPFRA